MKASEMKERIEYLEDSLEGTKEALAAKEQEVTNLKLLLSGVKNDLLKLRAMSRLVETYIKADMGD